MALGLIHLVTCAVFIGGLIGARGNTVRGVGWTLIAVAWVVSGIVLAIGAMA